MPLADQLNAIRDKGAASVPPPAKAMMQRATKELEDSEAAKQIIAVGSPLPEFEMSNQYGDTVASHTLLQQGPIVLTVYRGFW